MDARRDAWLADPGSARPRARRHPSARHVPERTGHLHIQCRQRLPALEQFAVQQARRQYAHDEIPRAQGCRPGSDGMGALVRHEFPDQIPRCGLASDVLSWRQGRPRSVLVCADVVPEVWRRLSVQGARHGPANRSVAETVGLRASHFPAADGTCPNAREHQHHLVHRMGPLHTAADPGSADAAHPAPRSTHRVGQKSAATEERGKLMSYFTLEHDGANPPAVFLHGFCQSSAYWEPTAGRLAAAGIRCVAPDLPGFGASADENGPYTMTGLADSLVRLLDARDIRRL